MKLILDATPPAGVVPPPAAALGVLIARLRGLGPPPLAWGGPVAGLESVAGWPDLLALLGNEPCAVVGIDQIFLDRTVARAGLKQAVAASGYDVFTQWEHCRAPVGTGLRVFAPGALRRTGAGDFASALAAMKRRPREFVFRYDGGNYASHADSLLDSRWRPALAQRMADRTDLDFSLSGFLGLARGHEAALRFVADAEASVIDERGLAVPYGFESAATAEFPTYLMFDLTNKCNATCIHCPHSVGFPGSDQPAYLSLDLFKRAVDQCVGRPMVFIRITADGEPLLHADFWDMLEYARDRGVGPLGVTTNGSALNERNARRLLESGAFMVDISLDAAGDDTYAKVRAGLSLERTRANVLKLIELRDALRSPLKVMVSFVKQKDNLHEVDAFRAFWSGRADEVLIREMISNVGINDVAGSSENIGDRRWPCPHVFRRTVVNYDGQLKYCPIDWVGGSVMRPLAQTTLAETWLDETYRTLRLAHLNNDFPSGSFCGGCRDWQGAPWSLGYEKVISRLGGKSQEP